MNKGLRNLNTFGIESIGLDDSLTCVGHKVIGLVAHEERLVVVDESVRILGILPHKLQTVLLSLLERHVLWLIGNCK